MANNQYIRKCQLLVYKTIPDRQGVIGVDTSRTPGLDLSQFRVQFQICAQDYETPNTAYIRVFNLSQDTMAKIRGEFDQVVLNAGYENGNYGLIFKGNIKQFRTGRISAIDTYLDIFAADGDQAYLQAMLNTSIAAGATTEQINKAFSDSFQQYGVQLDGATAGAIGGIKLSRGKVLFGMTREALRQYAENNLCSWSIQNGKVVFIPLAGYRPGEAVVMNMATGMVGVPEATDAGIAVRCLLNPKLQVGTLLKIDNKSINQTQINQQFFPGFKDINFVASLSHDGTYRTLVVEHIGDTRDNQWYSTLTCLAVNLSAPATQQVAPYGPKQPGQ